MDSSRTASSAHMKQLSDFVQLHTLGAGAYGSVSLVRCKRTGQELAMKRMVQANYAQRRFAVEHELPQRERDLHIVAGNSPYIVSLYYAFATSTDWLLILEYCPEGSLTKFIRSHGTPGLERSLAANLCGHVLQGIKHLHDLHIMHRSIKPDDVCVSVIGNEADRTPIAKIVDFGFAKHTDANRSNTIVGSYGYCAPEIDDARQRFGALAQSPEPYDHRVDLYSFGILLLTVLVGREGSDPNSTAGAGIWTHGQLREMLDDSSHRVWQCRSYQRLGITGDACLKMLQECGALDTIVALTATLPQDRPADAAEAGCLPFFRNFPGSVPAQWEGKVLTALIHKTDSGVLHVSCAGLQGVTLGELDLPIDATVDTLGIEMLSPLAMRAEFCLSCDGRHAGGEELLMNHSQLTLKAVEGAGPSRTRQDLARNDALPTGWDFNYKMMRPSRSYYVMQHVRGASESSNVPVQGWRFGDRTSAEQSYSVLGLRKAKMLTDDDFTELRYYGLHGRGIEEDFLTWWKGQ